MTEDEFCEQVGEVVTQPAAEALYKKLAEWFDAYEAVASEARYVHQQWLLGELTRRNGMNQLDEALRSIQR